MRHRGKRGRRESKPTSRDSIANLTLEANGSGPGPCFLETTTSISVATLRGADLSLEWSGSVTFAVYSSQSSLKDPSSVNRRQFLLHPPDPHFLPTMMRQMRQIVEKPEGEKVKFKMRLKDLGNFSKEKKILIFG